jgi:hypothetical protein
MLLVIFILTTKMPRDIMLSEISQTKKDKILHDLTYMWNLKIVELIEAKK